MVLTLLADGTLYLSLLFGWFYLWVVSANWQPPETLVMPWLPVVGSALLVTVASTWFSRLVRRLRMGVADGLQAGLLAVTALGVMHLGLMCALLLTAGLQPTASAHDAVFAFAWIYLLFHSGLVTLLTGLQAWRVARGLVSIQLPYEPGVLRPLWIYVMGVHWLTLGLFLLLPLTWGGSP